MNIQQDKPFLPSLPTLLALHRLPGMGPIKLKKILKSAFDIKDFGEPDYKGVEQDLKWAEQPNHHILTWVDDAYPKLLREIHASPPILFVKGDAQLLSAPQIAIVGSRNPTPMGRETAHRFARLFAERGLCVTSGLASGIDGAAHLGALQGNQGKTIAVLANGLDKIYPTLHQKLARDIVEHGKGALVSEFPIGILPRPSHFPRRNRIISGLSMGTLVVEATLKSGSLITANYALEQGREVFAIPGSIYSIQATGCHSLIRQGAKLVESPQDVLEDLGPLLNFISHTTENEGVRGQIDLWPGSQSAQGESLATEGFNKAEKGVLSQLGFEATATDSIALRCKMTVAEVSSILLKLELKGCIQSCSGGYIRVVG